MVEFMRIGVLAAASGCQVETIRYYEQAGVLPEPPRSGNNYRLYNNSHLHRLIFIRRLRGLGFSLEQVRVLLDLIDRDDYTCEMIKSISEAHLCEIRGKIADLKQMESSLTHLVKQCSGKRTPDCSMLEKLFLK